MWTKLSADKKSELMKAYKKGGFSYRDMINDYNTSYEKFDLGEETGDPTKSSVATLPNNDSIKKAIQEMAINNNNNQLPIAKMGGIQKFGPGGRTKLDTSNWEQSSLDSLNLYNKFYLPLEPGEARRPLTQEEKEFYKDEKTGIRPISMTYKISNPTAWGYAGNFPKPVGVQKKPVQATPYIDPNLNKPVKPTGPTKYQTVSKTGQKYYFANGKPVNENEYNTYYKNVPEIDRTTGLPINMYGGIQRFDEGGVKKYNSQKEYESHLLDKWSPEKDAARREWMKSDKYDPLIQLREVYPDDAIIKMLNTISQNTQKKSKYPTMKMYDKEKTDYEKTA